MAETFVVDYSDLLNAPYHTLMESFNDRPPNRSETCHAEWK
jgi:hypothetical protein